MDTITIRSESEAFDLLRKLADDFQFDGPVRVEFESWPRFVIRITGQDFDGTIPTRIMPTLLELQREVHRLYCRMAYGDESTTHRLTKKDREDLELLVRVERGSSCFETFLSEPIVKIFQDAVARMSPEQLTAVLIMFAISATSVLGWKLWLKHRTEVKELEQQIELSTIEKEKMDIVRRAAEKYPAARAAIDGVDEVRAGLLAKMKPSDHLEVDTSLPDQPYPTPLDVSGEQAEALTQAPRERAVERLIDDEFFLRTVDFTRPEGLRAQIERVSDGYAFHADIPLGVLGHEQAEALKNNSWSKRNVSMTLLVRELHRNFTSAKVISVKELT